MCEADRAGDWTDFYRRSSSERVLLPELVDVGAAHHSMPI